MPPSVARSAFVVLIAAAACVHPAGTDDSLTPSVRRDPRGSGKIAVSSIAGAQLAAFAVEGRMGGWVLHFLGASDSAGTLSYAVTRPTQSVPTLPLIGGTEMVHDGAAAALNACASAPVVFPNGNGIFLGSSLGCRPLPPGPIASAPSPREYASWSSYQYVVFVSSTAHLTDAQWEAVADSISPISTLTSTPARLGLLAFRGNPAARWMVTVQDLALKPTQDSGSATPSLRWSEKH